MLRDKKILLGITGSIAAYKAAFLVRELVREGAVVKVVMTDAAKSFITPLTLSTLSKNPVYSQYVKDEDGGVWTNHVELGRWADIMLIAPATALQIARMVTGKAENLLTGVYLSANCPVFVAPAMDHDMYCHASSTHNLAQLRNMGAGILDPGTGELASGLTGQGRMMEPETIVQHLKLYFQKKQRFQGKTVLITAGPTYEKIDPVRFIGNYSSGKMGYAIAKAFAGQGATVKLISGPVHLQLSHRNIHIKQVESADEMYQEAMHVFPQCDIAVLSAAVADYRVKEVAAAKIKKQDDLDHLTLELEKTPDIAKSLGKNKKTGQLLVGFALETHDEINNAKQKMKSKNLDLVILNAINEKGSGFMYDTNKITIIDTHNKVTDFELKSKDDVAQDITDCLYEKMPV